MPPENRSVYQVAREAGVSPISIHNWVSKVKEGKLVLDPEGTDPSPRDWPPAQKFRRLMEDRQIPAEARGEWLRTKGLEDFEFATLDWVHWYNTMRLMSSIGYVPPPEYEAAYYAQQNLRLVESGLTQ